MILRKKYSIYFLVGSLLLSPLTECVAATITIQNGTVTINGVVSENDYLNLNSMMANNVDVTSIVFQNCLGGTVSAGYKIAELIIKRQLNTVAKGQCQSSCAYAFLAGKKRSFDSSLGSHFILLHAGRNIDPKNNVISIVNPALMRYLSYLTNYKLSPVVKELIEQATTAHQGVVFMQTNYLAASTRNTLYCNGSENGNIQQCKTLDKADAFSQGVVTDNN